MPRITRKAILEAVASETGLGEAEFDLVKVGKGYAWTGSAAESFDDAQTGVATLSEWTLENWVADFKQRAANKGAAKPVPAEATPAEPSAESTPKAAAKPKAKVAAKAANKASTKASKKTKGDAAFRQWQQQLKAGETLPRGRFFNR
ncbi:hypothetical protein ACFSJ3_01005 [Corallincola platygyrae]|uniref:Uncharacterized protein n=1 Tax=Corallincola platygyrae TaxID=1193278 RepID=A0ABW4XKN2_9GAMM